MPIFVNYRRSDSLSITGRIDDHLRAAFGEADVYRDIDSIPGGFDFVEHLESSLEACDICVAIVGRSWVSERLNDEADFVRLELEIALRRRIPVIPVLVEGAELPKRAQIPAELGPLLRRQALRVVSGSDFRAHMHRLVQAIRAHRAGKAPGSESFVAPATAQTAPQHGTAVLSEQAAKPAPSSSSSGSEPPAADVSVADQAQSPLVLQGPPAADEWFVGINGVPIGPIGNQELLRRALEGSVTLDTRVWYDGLDEWLPLRAVPELVALLEGANEGSRDPRTTATKPHAADVAGPEPSSWALSDSMDALAEEKMTLPLHNNLSPWVAGLLVLAAMVTVALGGFLLLR